MSNELFAAHLDIGIRTVASWHQKPDTKPKSDIQQLLDVAYERSSSEVKQRFAELVGEAPDDDGATGAQTADVGSVEAERRLDSAPNLAGALEWLDQHAGWAPGTSRRKVSARLSALDVGALQARAAARGRVSQRDIHGALADYYGAMPAGVGTYAGSYGPDGHAATTLVTREDWLDLACPLHTPRDRLQYENEQDVAVQLTAPVRTLPFNDWRRSSSWARGSSIRRSTGSGILMPMARTSRARSEWRPSRSTP